MKLEMQDRPGQLISALTPISDLGANIIAVIHQREERRDGDTVAVQLVIDVPRDLLKTLIGRLKERDIRIIRVDEERLSFRYHVIMIGHLVHTDLVDTVDRIDRSGYAEVTEISLLMPEITGHSSALMTLGAPDHEKMEAALTLLRKVAEDKDLVLIEPMEELA